MSYAIISVGGKQYRVQEGQMLLVDRVALDDGATFTPRVLLVGGGGTTSIAPDDVVVTAKVLGATKGPKIRIGKYKKRTGYKRHTGFRASLTEIQIESIGTGKARAAKAAPAAKLETEAIPAEPIADAPELPDGYEGMTVADVKAGASGWDRAALQAALAYEQDHGKRKGALAALGAALAEKGA
jgi:large subunit ribosomal protein L21